MSGYTIQLQLNGRSCVVVGGGAVASRKIKTLLLSSAKIHVVAPVIGPEITQWVVEGAVSAERRPYAGGTDLTGALLVFAATDSDEVNARVCRDAVEMGLLACDSMRPERGSFIVPAALHRGSLVMTVSTSGASPGLAVKLRDELAQRYGDDYEIYVDFLAELRTRTHVDIVNPQLRRMIYHHVLTVDILGLIREGRIDAYRRHVLEVLKRAEDITNWQQELSPTELT